MREQNELLAGIRRVEHFRQLDETALQDIVQAGDIHLYPAGQMIFLEDEPCAGMYVLLAGRVHLVKLGPRGQQHIVAIVRPVIMFNEVAALDGQANPVTALAAQDCRTWRITHTAFQALLQRYPALGFSLLRVLAQRNRMLLANYHDLSFLPVLSRVAKLLLALSDQGRATIQRRDAPISMMAARVATVPEAVSRSLKELRQQGAIQITRTQIAIQQAEVLAGLAQVHTSSE